MTRVPQVTAEKMLAVLERAGFAVRHIKGSHFYLVHRTDSTRRTAVAGHNGDLSTQDVRDILRQARITRENFLKLL